MQLCKLILFLHGFWIFFLLVEVDLGTDFLGFLGFFRWGQACEVVFGRNIYATHFFLSFIIFFPFVVKVFFFLLCGF